MTREREARHESITAAPWHVHSATSSCPPLSRRPYTIYLYGLRMPLGSNISLTRFMRSIDVLDFE